MVPIGPADVTCLRVQGLKSCRAFPGVDERDLSLANIDLGVARAWLTDDPWYDCRNF